MLVCSYSGKDQDKAANTFPNSDVVSTQSPTVGGLIWSSITSQSDVILTVNYFR